MNHHVYNLRWPRPREVAVYTNELDGRRKQSCLESNHRTYIVLLATATVAYMLLLVSLIPLTSLPSAGCRNFYILY